GRAHGLGHIGGRVEDGVPRPPAQRLEVAVAIALQLLHLGEELRVRPAAVERRHLVLARERRLDQRAPDEPRPTEQQQPHATFQVYEGAGVSEAPTKQSRSAFASSSAISASPGLGSNETSNSTSISTNP